MSLAYIDQWSCGRKYVRNMASLEGVQVCLLF